MLRPRMEKSTLFCNARAIVSLEIFYSNGFLHFGMKNLLHVGCLNSPALWRAGQHPSLRVCVSAFCVSICSRVAKILKNSPVCIYTFLVHWCKFHSTPWPWPSFSRLKIWYCLVLWISRKRWEIEQTLPLPSDRIHVFAIEWQNFNYCTSWPWPTFSRSRILKCEYLANSMS